MSFSNSRWQLCVVRIWPIFLRNKRCFKGSKNPHENKPSHISWWLGCSSAFANLHPQLLCGLQKTHTPYLSPARYWRVVPYTSEGSKNAGNKNPCESITVDWGSYWSIFQDIVQHRLATIVLSVPKCFNDHFLMAFMFIYVHLKFQYSTTENRKIHDFVAPTFLRFFLVSKEVDHQIIHFCVLRWLPTAKHRFSTCGYDLATLTWLKVSCHGLGVGISMDVWPSKTHINSSWK